MAGALGMLIAIPVAASVKVVIDTFYPPEDHQVNLAPKPSALATFFHSVLHPGAAGKNGDEPCATPIHPKSEDLPLSVSEAISEASVKGEEEKKKNDV
jgi:hypothetical protein